jgi:hypothetical protein
MKKIVLSVFSMLMLSSAFSQVVDYNFNFEPGSTLGAWNYFDNGTNMAGVSIVSNPFPGGANSSATVAKFTAADDGGEWAGCESLYGTLGKWKFNGAAPTTVTIDVYKSTTKPVVIKFTSTNNSGQGTVFIGSQVPSAINQWVTLTYIVDFANFGGVNNGDNNAGTNQFVMHADQDGNRTADQVVYFDNLKFSATKLADPISPPAPILPPTSSAPIPPSRDPSNVVSVYSNAYTNIPGVKIGKNWGEATNASDIVVAPGDSVKRLTLFNYQGIILAPDAPAPPINLTGFEKVHIDFFKTDQAQIKFSIIHRGGGDVTKLINVSNDGWNSFDINLSEFVGLNLSTVHQIKLEGAPTQGSTTVYFDNLYFYKGQVSVQDFKTAKIRMYPNPVNNSLTIDATSEISTVSIFNQMGKLVLSETPKSTSATLETTNLPNGIYIIKTKIGGHLATSKFIKD